ncbi:hypothetical protein ABEB36_009616 [Hypothenemus hampei]|uniref:Uncharacterized protein n=1 Tax=Hypothenemus hampei TaxID=57062 RepID=A0ABD1EHE1_HYPHA
MEEVPSCSKTHVDAGSSSSHERSFENNDFKGEFTNAFGIVKEMLEKQNLLISNPPTQITSVSHAMAKELYDAIINVLNEYEIIVDDDLIMHEESDKEENFEECTYDSTNDPDYDPEDYKDPPADYIPILYKERAVALAEAHPTWSLATLQRMGAHRLKRKDYIQRWKVDIQKGGTRMDKLHTIDTETFERFIEARQNLEQVTTRTLQQWALASAFPYINDEFQFEACAR